eukprot:TRINITY_DN2215_c0_g1_i1.p1 TRINITY_DN2215_c0_g1~~TRINITY_DN2215_c0_g1_i1.p1  ORF type:complete len:329 (+),score=64.75 TRINITY_DN2215_c0_g1_i1:197-1183(+)
MKMKDKTCFVWRSAGGVCTAMDTKLSLLLLLLLLFLFAWPCVDSVLLEERTIDLRFTKRTFMGNTDRGECSECCSLKRIESRQSSCLLTSVACVHVVIASNSDYLIPLLASINSIQQKASNNTRVWFHLVVDEGEAKWLESKLVTFLDLKRHIVEIVEWSPIEISEQVKVWGKDGLPMHSNVFNYVRFYLPKLLPDLCTVIYLDPDTIVQVDLAELQTLFWIKAEQRNLMHYYDNNESGSYLTSDESRIRYYFAAVGSHASTPDRSSYEYLLKCKQKEIREVIKDCSVPFFNAGVFITDLSRLSFIFSFSFTFSCFILYQPQGGKKRE